jgi:subtilase family serine protease
VIRRLGVFLLTVVAIVSVNVVCQAQPQTLLTRHVREATVNGEAQSIGRLPATQSMHFDVVLVLRHQPELENFLQEVYDPSSPSYRQFVTVPEFTARFGPSQEDYDALISFAKANGFTVVGGSRDAFDVQFKGTVAAIEKAFHVTMGVYQHPTENRTFYAPDREPTVNLPFQLWHISGLDNYSIPRPLYVHRDLTVKSNTVKGSCPGSSYCGSDMRAAYYGSGSLNGSGQTLGLLEYLGYEISDLNTYFKNVGQTDNVPVIGVSTDGSSLSCLNADGCDDTEQIIDMTQSISMAPAMTALYVYVGATDTAMLGSMSTHSPLDAQLSSSWTWNPPDPSTDNPYFEKFAAQGQNYFQAAGDSGAYSSFGAPTWPSISQYVTNVGGTDLETTGAGGPWSSETAWVDGGGGYTEGSNFLIPVWQQLPGVINAANKGSTKYRNAPDVSAESNFDFYYCSDQSGCGTGLGGTSFAAPMWAGFLALVNQQVVANGNPTLGFINPAIYNIGVGSSYTSDFHDITVGSNGYPAVTGYDLATGWGSPIGPALISALAGATAPGFSLTAAPSSLSIAQGGNGTSKITITPSGGFSGNVTLSASGLPTGVTAGFSPNPATSTSTLTLTASASAATGTTSVTISGVSGSLTETTTLSLTVTASGTGPTVTVSPTSLTWGNTVLGATGAAKPVTLTNTGTVTLNISSITTSGAFAQATSTKPCGSTLAAGKSCVIKVTFTPTQVGVSSGTLTITDNSPSSPQTVTLSGTGIAQATITPVSATFAARTVGTTSPAKVFTLHNKQAVALTSIVSSTTGDFSISATTCGSSLAAKGTCTISVEFTPTAKGTRTGTLSVADSAIGSPQTASLTGTGK